MQKILARKHWIFDMDGTLTVAVHDFEAIRSELGIASRLPILEAISAMPAEEAAEKSARLDELEREAAQRSVPMPGATELLAALQQRGAQVGILTRNNLACAETTLAACGFDVYFNSAVILHRDSCAPKPEPDGVLKLLQHWRADPGDSLIVGDYLFDLQAGQRAGIVAVYLDTGADFPFRSEADLCINSLDTLASCIEKL